jgi:hypothetical protein
MADEPYNDEARDLFRARWDSPDVPYSRDIVFT